MASFQQRTTPPGKVAPPVLFFDDECGLCNRTVRWLIARDRRVTLRFAPLGGVLASQKVPMFPSGYDEETVVLWDDDGIHYRSDAILRSIACLGGKWRLVRVFFLSPRGVRDAVYRMVARNRIQWFRRVPSCALLSRKDRERLLP